jgi:transcriptional regulator of acetoin/glycerol metabolism
MDPRNSPAIFRATSGRLLSNERVWENFVSGGQPDVRRVPQVVIESWIRSRALGVNPALVRAPFEDLPDHGELIQRVPWLTAAEPVFRLLQSVFSEPHQLLLLGDASGLILLSHGGRKALNRAQELNALAGGKWGEKDVGCTAIGASLHTGSPARVNWFQTYCKNWHDWVNQAVPICDPVTQEVLGALNVAGFREVTHRGTLNLLAQAVSLIQMAVLEQETLLRMIVLERFMSLSGRYQTDALVAVDRRGRLLAANSAAERRLSLHRSGSIGAPIDQIKPLAELFKSDRDSFLEFDNGERTVNGVVVIPVTGVRPAGCLVVLKADSSRPALEWNARYSFDDLAGSSAEFTKCLELARTASQQDWPVLLLGESGTGKELFAQAIHNASPLNAGPFVVFPCAGINDELVSAELFGYTDGSYTGAAKGGREGKILLADKGTLFLDDVDSIPLKMQAALLRFVEDQRVLPIGATRPTTVDVRIIASSNRDLEEASRNGSFREDLFYRLNVFAITLPPLRERTADIPILARRLLSKYAPGFKVEDEALEALTSYSWPGNVRELRNLLLRATTVAKEGVITPRDLSLKLKSFQPVPSGPPMKPLRETEEDQIAQALKASKTVVEAAGMLGIHFTTLYRRMKKHHLNKT